MKRTNARKILAVLSALLIVGAAAVAWHLRERRTTYFTDADSIREPESQARVRDVLWQPAIVLQEGINTAGDEYEPRLTADGTTLLFVRGTPGDNTDVYASSRTPGGWTEPAPLDALNSAADELGPEPTPDGRSIYFYSNRAGGLGGYDIWVVRRDGEAWSEPRNLGPTVNSAYHEYAPCFADDPESPLLYFASNRPDTVEGPVPEGMTPTRIRRELGRLDYDLYAAPLVEGRLEQATALDEVNSDDDEGGPSVSPAGDFLYFSSNRAGGEGGFDLYRARRAGGALDAPSNLGPSINSAAHEMDPAVSLGGFGLHFSSDRPRSESHTGGYDLFYAASREVFRDVSTYRAAIDLPAMWGILWPYLIWLLASLLLMLALLRFGRLKHAGKLSLIARCLLGSLLAHMLLLFAMAFWQVTTSIADLDREGTGTRVVLVSPSIGRELMGQVRGQLTEVTLPSAMDAAQPKQQSEIGAEMPATMHEAAVEQAMLASRESMTEQARPEDAPASQAESADSAEPEQVDPAEALAVDLPSRPDREAVAEASRPSVQHDAPSAQAQADASEAAPAAPTPAVSLEVAAASSASVAARQAIIELPRPTETTGWSDPAPDQAVPVDLAHGADRIDLELPSTPDSATERRAETERTVIARVDAMPRQVASASRSPQPQRRPLVQMSPGANSSPDQPRSLATAGEAAAATGIPLPDVREAASGAATVNATTEALVPQMPDAPSAASAPAEAMVRTDVAQPASGRQSGAPSDAASGAATPREAMVAIAPSATDAPQIGTTIATLTLNEAAAGAVQAVESDAASRAAVAATPEAVEVRLPQAAAAASVDGAERAPSGTAARVATGARATTNVASSSSSATVRVEPVSAPAAATGEVSLVTIDAADATSRDASASAQQPRRAEATATPAASAVAVAIPTPRDASPEQGNLDGSSPAAIGGSTRAATLAAATDGTAAPTAELAPSSADAGAASSQSLVRADAGPARSAPSSMTPLGLPAASALVARPAGGASLPFLEEEPEATTAAEAAAAPTALAGVTRATIDRRPAGAAGTPTPPSVEMDVRAQPEGLADRTSLVETARHPLEDLPAATTLAMAPRDLDRTLTAETRPLVVTDLELPATDSPVANPYVHRNPETKKELVERFGGSEATEQAVAMALEWLARHQSEDGRWDGRRFDRRCGHCEGPSTMGSDIALTGLSLLSFMAAGHSHLEQGPYQDVVRGGLDWLLAQQSASGSFMGRESMYSHGIATMAVAEAYGLSGDVRIADQVKRAANFIIEARNRNVGGWRYEPGQVGDTSVMGWQVMALTSAKRAGIDIPDEPFDVARNWLTYVSRPTRPGLYAYQPGKRLSPAMTAEGMYVQQLLGRRPDDQLMRKSAEYLVQHLPDWRDDANTYYWYYGTLALFQHGGPEWRRWNDAVVDELIDRQETTGRMAGSWDPDGRWAKIGGRVYQTAICTLTLEVYYRYLPLYVIEEGEPQG